MFFYLFLFFVRLPTYFLYTEIYYFVLNDTIYNIFHSLIIELYLYTSFSIIFNILSATGDFLRRSIYFLIFLQIPITGGTGLAYIIWRSHLIVIGFRFPQDGLIVVWGLWHFIDFQPGEIHREVVKDDWYTYFFKKSLKIWPIIIKEIRTKELFRLSYFC